MKKLTNFIKQTWFLSLLGVILLSLVAYFAMPFFVSEENNFFATLVAIAVIFFFWIVFYFISLFRRKKKNQGILDSLEEEILVDDSEFVVTEELDTLNKRLSSALEELKSTKIGGKSQYLYQLPWYIVIGPPASGKTTLLKNSSIKTALSEKFGREAISGVSGTRNCDWWFTEEAVLLDTAGRYTTQDSHEESDKQVWRGFLQLLQKNRTRRPLNGIIIAIGMDEILIPSEANQHAKKIRLRLQELYKQFDLTLPVYLVFTKTDLLAGFRDFFDELTPEERTQVWGSTFTEKNKAVKAPLPQLEAELDLLESSLKAKRILKLEKEVDLERRKNIYIFPEQFRSVKNSINDFVNEVFAPSRYQQKILLRGVYFTSAEQTGSPIDKLLGSIAHTFGLEHGLSEKSIRRGKSFFIDDLLQKVIFSESELAGLSPKYEKKRSLYKWGTIGFASLLFLSASGLWLNSYLKNQEKINYTSEQVAKLKTGIQQQGDKDAAGEFRTSLQIIDRASNLTKSDEGWLSTLGLSQQAKLSNHGRHTYNNALQIELLPHIVQTLEEKLVSYQDEEITTNELLKTLKAYLILSPSKDPKYETYFHENKSLIKEQMDIRWSDELTPEQRTLLGRHLNNLLTKIPPRPSLTKAGIGIKENLVNTIRSHLLESDISTIMFEQVKADVRSKSKNLKTFATGLGNKGAIRNADKVFMRKSGEPMTSGIDGLFTYNGFKSYEKHAQQSIQSFLHDDWVLGEELNINQQDLQESLADLYFSEFQQEWNIYLQDFKIIKPTNLNHAGQLFKELRKSKSPLNIFLRKIGEETYLSKPSLENSSGGAIERAAKVAERQAIQAGGRAVSLAAEVAGSEAIGNLTSLRINSSEDDPVSLHFEDLRMLNDESSTDLEQLQQALDEVGSHLNTLQSHLTPGSRKEVKRKLRDGIESSQNTANTLPLPVSLWIIDFLKDIELLISNNDTSSVSRSWKGQVYSEYSNKIKGKFPIARSGGKEIPLGDFADFFGTGGTIDNYIKSELIGSIDTSSRKWRSIDGFSTISNKSLTQLQRADKIRSSFFPKNSQDLKVKFDIKVIKSTPNMAGVRLQIGEQMLTYNKGGSNKNIKMEWPSPSGANDIVLDLLVNGKRERTEKEGHWSIIKFAQTGRIKALSGRNMFDLSFTHKASAEIVVFRISTDRSDNLFNGLKELKAFQLPGKLVN